ncbi:MAG: hypothetical protein HQK53_08605 [Oligoflexia bacterium]|nr:hypothetical protein [Oligoflexia bacterium]
MQIFFVNLSFFISFFYVIIFITNPVDAACNNKQRLKESLEDYLQKESTTAEFSTRSITVENIGEKSQFRLNINSNCEFVLEKKSSWFNFERDQQVQEIIFEYLYTKFYDKQRDCDKTHSQSYYNNLRILLTLELKNLSNYFLSSKSSFNRYLDKKEKNEIPELRICPPHPISSIVDDDHRTIVPPEQMNESCQLQSVSRPEIRLARSLEEISLHHVGNARKLIRPWTEEDATTLHKLEERELEAIRRKIRDDSSSQKLNCKIYLLGQSSQACTSPISISTLPALTVTNEARIYCFVVRGRDGINIPRRISVTEEDNERLQRLTFDGNEHDLPLADCSFVNLHIARIPSQTPLISTIVSTSLRFHADEHFSKLRVLGRENRSENSTENGTENGTDSRTSFFIFGENHVDKPALRWRGHVLSLLIKSHIDAGLPVVIADEVVSHRQSDSESDRKAWAKLRHINLSDPHLLSNVKILPWESEEHTKKKDEIMENLLKILGEATSLYDRCSVIKNPSEEYYKNLLDDYNRACKMVDDCMDDVNTFVEDEHNARNSALVSRAQEMTRQNPRSLNILLAGAHHVDESNLQQGELQNIPGARIFISQTKNTPSRWNDNPVNEEQMNDNWSYVARIVYNLAKVKIECIPPAYRDKITDLNCNLSRLSEIDSAKEQELFTEHSKKVLLPSQLQYPQIVMVSRRIAGGTHSTVNMRVLKVEGEIATLMPVMAITVVSRSSVYTPVDPYSIRKTTQALFSAPINIGSEVSLYDANKNTYTNMMVIHIAGEEVSLVSSVRGISLIENIPVADLY